MVCFQSSLHGLSLVWSKLMSALICNLFITLSTYDTKDWRQLLGTEGIIWRRQYRQLDDKEVYEQILLECPCQHFNESSRKKYVSGEELLKDTPSYFLVTDPKFARFYMLPKIHKRLHDEPRRPVLNFELIFRHF